MKSSFDNVVRGRLNWVLLFFLTALSLLVGRLFILQIVYHNEYRALALRQHRLVREIVSNRGIIYAKEKDGTLVPLTLNNTEKNLAASPKHIKEPAAAASLIAKELGTGINEEEILKKLSNQESIYTVIAKHVSPEIAEKLALKLPPGVFFEEEMRRVYPHGNFLSHAIGFVSKESDQEEGRYGLERFYETSLSGKEGFFEGAKSASGFWVALGKRIINPPQNGSSLFLTIDYNIQFKAEEILNKTKEKWEAVSGALLVLDPKTGKILAMAARPSFDANAYSKEKDFSVFLNPLTESMFELGSVIKPITMASALAEGLIEPGSTYEDNGEVKIGGYSVKNFDGKAYHRQTMTQVIEKSLNTGAVYVARLLGKNRHREYLQKFGFGEKTGVDLPGELAGDISNLAAGRDIEFATASFGQGIAITPLQLAQAIGSLANEGKLMRPYIVEKVVNDSGNEIKKEPEIIRQVVSKESAEKVTKMLVSTVRNGFENRAGIKGYFVAGKTGTAQIPRKDGRGYSDRVIHTFVGYAPAFNPRFLILLQLNEPKGNRFAANTLTPAFHDLAEYILNYYEVPPDEK